MFHGMMSGVLSIFFFKQNTAYEMRISDWSSDVCSSDLQPRKAKLDPVEGQPPDLTRLDDGCSFRPRCRYAVERCAQEFPPLDAAGDANHFSACWEKERLGRSAVKEVAS